MRIAFSLAALAIGFTWASVALAEDKKPDEKSGTVAGVVTAKGEGFLEVKGDGEEKGRRYVPEWKGGAPAQGGGLDKDMLKLIKEVKVGDRVRLEWKFDERARVVKLEVIKSSK
jgi:hypothetical protein